MVRSRALIQIPAACALALSLAGCGAENPKPAPAPTKSASASSSPSGEVAPRLPAEARGTSEAAAKAFVRHYLATFSYAARTGRVDELRSLGGASCESCSGVINRIADTYSAGGHADGRGYEARSMRVASAPSPKDQVVVTLNIYSFQQVIYANPNAKPRHVPAVLTKARFELSRSATGWSVRDWTRL